MKQLQNNFTTPEQSKRLLELGLPADSADLGIIEDIMHGGIEVLQIPYSQWCKGYENISTPCWSVGRLIEILCICKKGEDVSFYTWTDKVDLVEWIIYKIEVAEPDFSKLDE